MKKRSIDDVTVTVLTFVFCAAPVAMLLIVLFGVI